MFKFIFYSYGIIFFIYELWCITNPKKMQTFSIKAEKVLRETKGKKFEDDSSEEKSVVLRAFGVMSFIFWMFLGLFTFNWALFSAKLILNLVFIAPISKLVGRESFAWLVLHWLNSVIGAAFALFVIINAYHLRIDFWPIILNWF